MRAAARPTHRYTFTVWYADDEGRSVVRVYTHTLFRVDRDADAIGYADMLLDRPAAWAVDIARDGRDWCVVEAAERRPAV